MPDELHGRGCSCSADSVFVAAVQELPFAEAWTRRWGCRRLDRLALELGRRGWMTRRRYEQEPPLLHVFPENTRCAGDSIAVVYESGCWSYQSSLGVLLGPCSEPGRAAEAVTGLLAAWGIRPGDGSDSPEAGDDCHVL